MISVRPPKAAAGRPPPMTFPYVHRSASDGSRPCQPVRETRNPVITSSTMSSAPYAWAIAASCWLKPSRGATTPMLPAAASVMIAAMCGPSAAKASSTAVMSLYGSTMVSPAAAPVTPGESGRPRVATPEPAAASRASECPW